MCYTKKENIEKGGMTYANSNLYDCIALAYAISKAIICYSHCYIPILKSEFWRAAMGYQKAEELLPLEVIELIQQYVDGQSIYIPRKEDSRKKWGQNTNIHNELAQRNQQIYLDYIQGSSTSELAGKYYLSQKSIQRILRSYKQE